MPFGHLLKKLKRENILLGWIKIMLLNFFGALLHIKYFFLLVL